MVSGAVHAGGMGVGELSLALSVEFIRGKPDQRWLVVVVFYGSRGGKKKKKKKKKKGKN